MPDINKKKDKKKLTKFISLVSQVGFRELALNPDFIEKETNNNFSL